ncbi:toll-like receptor 8 [Gadus chalcogrammus]|uniref:toll-like receptor 8 n=1 Tax=Gadus chalcogrammus TaxID=1042646 RepID=UPI0024C4A3EB|nr:toll-like receptor 8 [Gadus chalcogrammus]
MNTPIYWPYLVGRLLLFLHQGSHTAMFQHSTNWMSRQFPCDVNGLVFDCGAKNLQKVPDGITSNATVVNLSKNNLQQIPGSAFSHLKDLTELNLNNANMLGLQNANINKYAFKNLTKLLLLDLGNNRLTYIPGNLPHSLTTIWLNNNRILVLNNNSFSGIRNVKNLFLQRNCYLGNNCSKQLNISDNTFAVLTKLEFLDLSLNNLTRVPKGLPITLTELTISDNQIYYISEEDFKELHHLNVLSIHGNCQRCENAAYHCIACPNISLGIHPKAFTNLNQLKTLHLAGNSLTELNDFWFENLKQLTRLLLSFNLLEKAIQGELKCFSNLSKLAHLDLSFNFRLKTYPKTVQLSNAFSKLKSLRVLHLVGLVFRRIEFVTLKALFALKHLTVLNLGTNFIVHCNSTIFKNLPQLQSIYLSENKLYPVSVSTPNPPGQGGNVKVNLISSPQLMANSLNFGGTLANPECIKAGRVLSFSSNNLFFITPEQFEGYDNISCLNLSRNGFSSALNGTEFKSLPNLTYLDLSFNKIDLAYSNAFQELQKLKVLDISFNDHYFKAYGITNNLDFVKNLPVLEILNMSNNCIHTLTTKWLQSDSLKELRFGHNELGTLWKDDSYINLFTNITNLNILDISSNNIVEIPDKVYVLLPWQLTTLFINDNKLSDFNWTKLEHFNNLQTLDLSHNAITYVRSVTTRSLITLNLAHNKIAQLSNGFIEGAKRLKTLLLNHNELTVINQTNFLTRPKNLTTLSLHRNPFQCSCDAMDFILWIEGNNVTIPSLKTDVYCFVSYGHPQVMIYFDFDQCVNDTLALLISILTTTFIVVTTSMATVAHIFYWDASYVLHYLKAKWKGYHSSASQDNVYDVFVTYDTKDPWVSEWVLQTLRVKLEVEGEKALPLCLEERDWPLGVPAIDNLTHSIRYSRKTLFVLTKAYAKTGMFRLAMYLAHQRLLDENLDVIVVLMLEPVLQNSHFLHLRRRLCGESVVEWPRTAAAEPWFWQNLRNVVRVDNQTMYTSTYSQYFTCSRERD